MTPKSVCVCVCARAADDVVECECMPMLDFQVMSVLGNFRFYKHYANVLSLYLDKLGVGPFACR